MFHYLPLSTQKGLSVTLHFLELWLGNRGWSYFRSSILGCLAYNMTISLIGPQHQLTAVTCIHKCDSHVQLIQSNVSPSLSLSSPLNRSQCLNLIIAISVGFLIQDSFHFVQSTSSYINVDLDSEATGIFTE